MAQIDEDAPALAGIAAQAIDVLNDATCSSVRHPGLRDLADTEAVLVALTRLADELQDTSRNLTDYLLHQRADGRLTGHDGSAATAGSAVEAASDALEQVRAAAAQMASLLTRAEVAMLALAPTRT